VVFNTVTEFTPEGCKTSNDEKHDLDVLICATGFDTSFRPRFPLRGKGSADLRELWSEEPHSYMGVAVPDFPNYFMFIGPQSPLVGGSLMPVIEAQADYILHFVDRFQTENIQSMSPKAVAVADFISHVGRFSKSTVWSDTCGSWYSAATPASASTPPKPATRTWPGSILHYLEAIREPRSDDWDISYKGNRFDWLGNGFSQTEFDATADLAYYLCTEDGSPFASRRKRREQVSASGSQPERQLLMPLRFVR